MAKDQIAKAPKIHRGRGISEIKHAVAISRTHRLFKQHQEVVDARLP
jgi:hypothetical protein